MASDDAGRRRRQLELFEAVVDLDPAARAAHLRAACSGDAALRAAVEAMLAADDSDAEPFSGDAGRWADALAATPATPVPADAADARVGETVGAWRITGLLGRGGMGAVHAAERADGAYVQQAALKRVHGGDVGASARERFLRERQVLARLRHPHIATLLDGGFDAAGDPYFVMERVEGQPIDRWCDERRLPLRARVALFLQVLDAVQFAHRNLVVHRDLKPSNLLVDAYGQVKLLDFGIARELEAVGATPTATSDRAMTLLYASPEQLDDGPITTATDVFQLGVVLYRLLTGAHPFGIEPDTPLARQLQALSRDPEPLTEGARDATTATAALRGETPASLARAVDGTLAAIVAACLRRDPAARYASAEALAADLRAWGEDRPVSAARLGPGRRARLWLRRNRALAASAAAIGLALVAGTGVATWQAREARAQAAIAEREGATARATLAFLADTLAAASPEQALATEVSVRDLLDHARRQLDARGAVEPAVRRPVLRMLGHLYLAVGDPAAARDAFDAGLEGATPRSRDEALALADDWIGYSDALTGLEIVRESREAGDRAAALRRQWAPDDPLQQFRILAHASFGDYIEDGLDAGIAQLGQAIALARAHPGFPLMDRLDALDTLIGMHFLRGDSVEQLALADEALALIEAARLPADAPQRIPFLRFRGVALTNNARPADAEPVLREAIAIQARTGARGSPPMILWNELAGALAQQGKYREAMDAFERAQAPGSTGPESGSIAEGGVLANLAAVQGWAGDYPRALAGFDRAVAIFDAGGTPAHESFRRAYERNRASAWIFAGRGTDARRELERLRIEAKRIDGADSKEYAQTTLRLAIEARVARDPDRGEPLLAEARRLLEAQGAAGDLLMPHLLRNAAAFAAMRGDLARAEALQREALAGAARKQNGFDLATTRAELAALLHARGDAAGARVLLAQALPVMRDAVLPAQVDLVAAEALDATLRAGPATPASRQAQAPRAPGAPTSPTSDAVATAASSVATH